MPNMRKLLQALAIVLAGFAILSGVMAALFFLVLYSLTAAVIFVSLVAIVGYTYLVYLRLMG